MYRKILVPIDLADQELAKPAVATALMMAGPSDGAIRFVNVLPLTPVMLAEYVPPDFEVQQRKAAEDALAIVVKEVLFRHVRRVGAEVSSTAVTADAIAPIWLKPSKTSVPVKPAAGSIQARRYGSVRSQLMHV